jgi:hypothetical protein
VVRVPGDNAAGLNDQLPQAQEPAVDMSRLLGNVDRADDGVGDARGRVGRGRADVDASLAHGAFAGESFAAGYTAEKRDDTERMRDSEHIILLMSAGGCALARREN